MDRRNMMLMTGLAALAATVPTLPAANASPAGRLPAPTAPPDGIGAPVDFLFADEFDGPAGSGPDPARWNVQNYDDIVNPPVKGHYRDDRRNVFLDGNSNLVILVTQEGSEYFSGKLRSNFRGPINTTWEARIKLDCITPGAWPAYWLVNEDPLPDGEIDVVEWYGNPQWAPGSTVHTKSDGKTWSGKKIPELVDNGWHTWRVHWGDDGFQFWRDYVDGAKPYFSVPAVPIGDRWPFGIPGYWLTPVLNVAVGGPGGGDPGAGSWPAAMLVDWIHVW